MELETLIKWAVPLLALSGCVSCGDRTGGSASCQYQTPSGLVDLSPLANQGGEPRFKGVKERNSNSIGYSWNPCSVFNEGSCRGVEVCQVMMGDPSTYYTLGTPGEGGFIQQGDTLFYHYVHNSDSTVRETYIELACDMNVEGKLEFQTENPKLTYRLKLTSQYACPRALTTPPQATPLPTAVIYLLAAVLICLCILICMVFIGLLTRRRRSEVKESRGHVNHAFEKKPLPP